MLNLHNYRPDVTRLSRRVVSGGVNGPLQLTAGLRLGSYFCIASFSSGQFVLVLFTFFTFGLVSEMTYFCRPELGEEDKLQKYFNL